VKRGLGRLIAVLVAAAACIDLSTDPDEIVAIEFPELPWPSIVAGDTLRDASGAVVPLTVRLLGGDGDVVTGNMATTGAIESWVDLWEKTKRKTGDQEVRSNDWLSKKPGASSK